MLTFYCIKNVIQGTISTVAVILAFLYEFTDELPEIKKSFLCDIKNSIDYWAGLDTVQCFYHPIALNDVFIIFYGIMSILVVIATVFGFVDIFARMDLDKGICGSCECCKTPTDTEILKYCLGEEQRDNGTGITIRDSEIVNVNPSSGATTILTADIAGIGHKSKRSGDTFMELASFV